MSGTEAKSEFIDGQRGLSRDDRWMPGPYQGVGQFVD